MTNSAINGISFSDFVLKDRRNRMYGGIALLINIVTFTLFKEFLYPFPNFCPSSYSFIGAASTNAASNLWPIGYSKFLWLFHQVTHSDTALVAFQFFFLTAVLLYFFCTVHYFYRFGKESFNLLFSFLFFDPLFLYLANYIVSDALFLGCSLWWFTQLIWILHRPKPYYIVTHALLLFVAFTISYTAAYYLIVSCLTFAFSPQKPGWKISGMLLGPVLIVLFVMHTLNANEQQTGHRQFSAFSGWRQADNALFMYPHVIVDSSQLPEKYEALDRMVRKYFQHADNNALSVGPADGFFYIVRPNTPLLYYLSLKEDLDHPNEEFKKVAAASPLFSDYARYLVDGRRGAYVQYFLLPNLGVYWWPTMDKLVTYNIRKDTVNEIVRSWFDYPYGAPAKPGSKYLEVPLLSPFPAFFLGINICFILGLAWFLWFRNGIQVNPYFLYGLGLSTFFLFLNAGFSIWLAPIVFESQVFPMIVCFSFVLLLYDYVEKKYKRV